MDKIKSYNIEKYTDNGNFVLEDDVIVEYPLTIYVNDKNLCTLYMTPDDIRYLIIGDLYTRKIINRVSDIKELNLLEDENKAFVKVNKLSKRKDVIKKVMILDRNDVYNKIYEFENQSDIFKKTGASHLVAIADNNKIIRFKEDVSRNNAIDKIIGYILEKDIDISDKYLLLSCRISASIMQKIISIGIRTVISVAPPTSMAINMAKENDINLIGFARDKRFNLYNRKDLKIK